MASSKLDMVDFLNNENFPFIIDDGNIVFGPIYNKQANNKIRSWEARILLYNHNDRELNITKPIINKIKNTAKNQYYCIIKKITYNIDNKDAMQDIISDTLYEGKNIGKKNETNILQQSLIIARGYYLKKLRNGFSLDLDAILNNITINKLPFPMAVNEYSKHIKKIVYPYAVQPKLDGIRAIIFKDKITSNIRMISRRHKEIYGFDHILKEIEDMHFFEDIKNQDVYLDGELYNHDYTLQKISGIVRTGEESDDKKKLYFYMFDIFDTSNPDLVFPDRMQTMFTNFSNLKYVKVLETHICNNVDETEDLLSTYLQDRYEGLIYKPLNRKYEFSFDKEKRSNYYLKRKPFYENEFLIVGYELDKNGFVIFIMETEDKCEFKSVPMWDHDKRKDFKKSEFNRYYLNKYATIRYDDLSDNNIPVRSRFVTVRDYE